MFYRIQFEECLDFCVLVVSSLDLNLILQSLIVWHSGLNYVSEHCHHYILTNCLSHNYTYSIKYLEYIFSSDSFNDVEMRLLYCRSNRLLRMFNKCSQNVFIELCRSFYTTFHCPYVLTPHTKATFSKLRVACNNVYCKVLFWSQATKQCQRNVCVQYHVSNISSKHFEVN